MDKPDVDVIEGLSPAISIDQKSAEPQPPLDRRHDHRGLRLPAPAVRPHRRPALPGRRHAARAPDAPADRRPRPASCPRAPASRCWRRSCGAARASTTRCSRTSPAQGFVRARIDGEVVDIDEFLKRTDRLARYEQHKIEVVVDRLVLREGIDRRLTDSLETALKLADGVAEVELVTREGEAGDERDADVQPAPRVPASTGAASRSRRRATSRSTRRTAPARRATASARTFEIDPELVIPDPDLSLNDGAIAPWRSAHTQYFTRMLDSVADDRRHRHGRAVGHAHGQAAEGHPPRHRRQPDGQVQEPLRPPAPVHDHLRGRHPVDQAPPRGRRERLVARAVRGLHARGAVPGVRRRPAQAGDAGRHDQRLATSPRSATCRSASRPSSSPPSS